MSLRPANTSGADCHTGSTGPGDQPQSVFLWQSHSDICVAVSPRGVHHPIDSEQGLDIEVLLEQDANEPEARVLWGNAPPRAPYLPKRLCLTKHWRLGQSKK